VILILFLLVCGSLFATTPPVDFAEHLIAAGLTGGSQVVITDLNRDGKPDILVVSTVDKELVWFENPTWRRHVIISDLSGMTNVAPWDIDGDGIPELVLAHEFAEDPPHSLGILAVLKHADNLQRPWKITEIDRIPTSYRLRWADLKGDGKRTLVNAPFVGIAPGKTPLVLYKPGAWIRESIAEENDGPVRSMNIANLPGEAGQAILTAGAAGIHLFHLPLDGECMRMEVSKIPSLDAAAGSLSTRRDEKTPFVAALDPFPTTQISVYKPDRKVGWRRQIIVDGLTPGSSILTADLNGDGSDEIISGGFVFYAKEAKGDVWSKSVLDTDAAPSVCVAADVDGDGKADIACLSPTTGSLKWYENKGVRK